MADPVGGLSEVRLAVGIAVEAIALLLIPVVLIRRKEPASTVAWVLALVFLPGVGATLFLLFGRDRVRLPARRAGGADRARPWRCGAAGGSAAPRPDGAAGEALDAAMPWGDAPPIASPVARELFRIGAALTGARPTSGNAATLLVDGEATYAAIGAAIDGAERHIYAEYYLIRSDATADWLRDRLVAAARRGVEVRLLVDGYGSFWLTRRWLRSLRLAGASVAFFLPAWRFFFLQPMNLRNHRKILVVDGAVAFTGGINIGDEYCGRRGPWRDTHLRLTGPSVAELAQVFADDWRFATGEEPPPSTRGDRPPHAPEVAGEEPPPSVEPLAPRPDAIVSIVRSGPEIEGVAREAIHRLLFAAITLARSRVYITTPYLIPDRSIVVALQTAALRGVDVRLLLPSRSNHQVVWLAGRSFYEELLEAGVQIYEYGPGMIHAKTMAVDGGVALVGSANMDVRSFRLNLEVHAIVCGDRTVVELERRFEDDFAASRRIDLDAFRRRSRALRALEGAARLTSPLM